MEVIPSIFESSFAQLYPLLGVQAPAHLHLSQDTPLICFDVNPYLNKAHGARAFVCVLVIRRDAALIHPFLYDVEYLFVLRHPQAAVLDRDDIVASRCIKACHYIAIPVISHRNCALLR